MEIWKCIDGCKSECCGIVPMPIQTYNTFKRRVKKKIVDIMKLNGHVVLMTDDMSCAFLDNNYRCSIYDHRPMICKIYGTTEKLPCPYIDTNGNKRTDEDVIKTKELIKIQDKIRMDMIK